MAWEIIESGRNSGGRGSTSYALRISRHGKNKLSISFGAKLLKKLRWKFGDRLNFLIDRKDLTLGIQRTNDGIRTLTHSGGAKNSGNRNNYCCVRAAMREVDILKKIVGDQPRIFESESDLFIDYDNDLIVVEFLEKK